MFTKTMCVIPARGDSKGIVRKNLQMLGRYPLFVHSILHAINDGIPKSQIIVSSDDKEILKIASDFNVVSHSRPHAISTDTSSTELCLIDAYKNIPHVQHCDTIITLQPTSPIRAMGRIKSAMHKYCSGSYNSLLTATKFYNFMWFEKEDSDIWYSSFNPRHRPMRQELGLEDFKYFENGNIYITHIPVLLETECRIGNKVCVYQISEQEGIQIDTPQDLEICRQVFAGLSTNGQLI